MTDASLGLTPRQRGVDLSGPLRQRAVPVKDSRFANWPFDQGAFSADQRKTCEEEAECNPCALSSGGICCYQRGLRSDRKMSMPNYLTVNEMMLGRCCFDAMAVASLGQLPARH